MTAQEFQVAFSADLKKVLESQMGQNLVQILGGLRPQYEMSPHEHLFSDNRGSIRGYETCLRNLIGLAMPPKIAEQPPVNYGVPDKKEE